MRNILQKMPFFMSVFTSALVGGHVGLSWWLIPVMIMAGLSGYGAAAIVHNMR